MFFYYCYLSFQCLIIMTASCSYVYVCFYLADQSDLPILVDYELLEQVHHKYLLLVCFQLDW